MRKQDALVLQIWMNDHPIIPGTPGELAISLFSGSQLAVLRLRARETLEAFRREGGNTEFPNARLVVGETGLEMQPKEFLGLRGGFVVIEAVFSHIFYAAIETKLMYSEQLPVLEKPK